MCSGQLSLLPSAGRAMNSILCSTNYVMKPSVVDWVVVCLPAAQCLLLLAVDGHRMCCITTDLCSVRCHLWDCKVLLVTSHSCVGGAMQVRVLIRCMNVKKVCQRTNIDLSCHLRIVSVVISLQANRSTLEVQRQKNSYRQNCNMVEWFWWYSSLISTTNWIPSVLWHCWFGHLGCKKLSPKWPIMCRVGR